MADVLRFPHRLVELPVKTLDDIAREHGVEAQHDPIDLLRHYRPSTLDRIADALGSRRALDMYIGVYIGIMLTVTSAICWSLAS